MASGYAQASSRASREIAPAQQAPLWTMSGRRQKSEMMRFLPRSRIAARFDHAETDEVAIRAVAILS
jgi:hypothetical protein